MIDRDYVKNNYKDLKEIIKETLQFYNKDDVLYDKIFGNYLAKLKKVPASTLKAYFNFVENKANFNIKYKTAADLDFEIKSILAQDAIIFAMGELSSQNYDILQDGTIEIGNCVLRDFFDSHSYVSTGASIFGFKNALDFCEDYYKEVMEGFEEDEEELPNIEGQYEL